jgi:DNA invertase Pin-like site-specific DNA recombinase
MSKPIRAALYARVSTSGHGQDVGLQLDELRQVATQRFWVAAEFVDEGVSGSKDRRPALDRMMADARAGRLDVVAVWRFDRFARDTRHLLTAMDEFRALGVHFVSLREQVDTSTPMGKAMFTIISAISELERDLIRERVVAGVRRAQAAGKHCGRPKVGMDLRPAVAMLREGRGLKDVSSILKVSRATLRRRLQEAGTWPLPGNPEADGIG